jgi:hypothetical protein
MVLFVHYGSITVGTCKAWSFSFPAFHLDPAIAQPGSWPVNCPALMGPSLSNKASAFLEALQCHGGLVGAVLLTGSC